MNYTAETENRKLRLNIYDAIGADWSGGGVTPQQVAQSIAEAGEIDQIDVHINSPGGVAFDGVAIYNQLVNFPGLVNVFVDGLAASAASIIAMAGQQRVVNKGGVIMIHNASAVTMGTKETHAKQVAVLDKLDRQIAKIYSKTTGNDPDEMLAMMKEETWMDCDDALVGNFATHVAPAQAEACVSPAIMNFYNNVPPQVAAWAGPTGTSTTPPTVEPITMADEQKPEEVEEPTSEEHEEEETMESLRAKVAELEEKLQAMEPGEEEEEQAMEPEEEEEMSNDARDIARAFAHDESFAVQMIGEGVTLAEAHEKYTEYAAKKIANLQDGEDPVATVRPDGNDLDAAALRDYTAAKAMKTESVRNGFLNSRGYDLDHYKAWSNK